MSHIEIALGVLLAFWSGVALGIAMVVTKDRWKEE